MSGSILKFEIMASCCEHWFVGDTGHPAGKSAGRAQTQDDDCRLAAVVLCSNLPG